MDHLLAGLDAAPSVDAIIEALRDKSDVLHEILEFRQMIEPQIAALAAVRTDTANLIDSKFWSVISNGP